LWYNIHHVVFTPKEIVVERLILSLCLLVGVAGFASAESISVDRAIEIIQNSEKGVDVAKWRCQSSFYRIRDGQKERSPHYQTEEVMFDFRARLYRITNKGISEAQDSQGRVYDEPFTEEYSFDGSVYREWYRSESGREQMVMGVITKDLGDAVLNRQCVERDYPLLGLLSGFPTIFRLQAGGRDRFPFYLSYFLKENRTSIVSCILLESGELAIELSIQRNVADNIRLLLTVEIQYDPSSSVVTDRKSTRLNSSHLYQSRMPSSA
jgi:hypothetical protein